MPRLKPTRLMVLLLLLLATGCGFLRPLPSDVGLDKRLASFPRKGLPLEGRVEILWNQNQIPFILAEKDRDLPFALGLVHAHLRLAQIETMRRISQGRLGEIMGPFVSKADHAIRIIDFPKAAGAIVQNLPPETKAWLERFLQGLNHYIMNAREWPPELEMLGVKRKPWRLEELLALGRLACTDVNWLYWYTSLSVEKQPAWPELWKRLKAVGLASHPSFLPPDNLPMGLTAGSVKSGSNCLAVAGSRTKSGAALLANDAHVGLSLPALWLLVGMKSPSLHQVGFTMPGMPVIMMGRNRHIAWGGTNMLSFSSSLYDLSRLKDLKFTTRKEKLKLRWWFDREITVRDSNLGPVVSDAPFFEERGLPPLALKWRGHTPSDETSAFLKINRAENWRQFRAAFASYAVSGQNMLYADDKGNIGQVMALEYDPAAGRTGLKLLGDPTDPAELWGNPIKSTRLPAALNPEEGFLASTNNTPVRTDPPISLFNGVNDRYRRLAGLAGEKGSRLRLSDLKKMQQDVYSASSLALAREMAAGLAAPPEEAKALAKALSGWDGKYLPDSKGAAVLELLAYHLAQNLYGEMYGPEAAAYLLRSATVYRLLLEDLKAGRGKGMLPEAALAANRDWQETPRWGDLHRLELAHPLGDAPLIGYRFRFGDYPWPGSSNTLFKSAHGLANETHGARYGANARFVCDLGDPDENYFALLGGEDGYLGSVNYLDMFKLWQKGAYVRVPLEEKSLRAAFGHSLVLLPGGRDSLGK